MFQNHMKKNAKTKNKKSTRDAGPSYITPIWTI